MIDVEVRFCMVRERLHTYRTFRLGACRARNGAAAGSGRSCVLDDAHISLLQRL